MENFIKSEFLDIINYAICQSVNDYLDEKSSEFFKKVGKYHLDEALERRLIQIDSDDQPLDVLIKIARYLESAGYMEKILINKLSEREAFVEMYGVSVTRSSVKLLNKNRHPSHYMTNVMLAALEKIGVQAELRDVEFDEEKCHFKEHWKIL